MSEVVYHPPVTPEDYDLFAKHHSEPWIDSNGETQLGPDGKTPLTWFEIQKMYVQTKENSRKRELQWAIKSRILTNEEMCEVEKLRTMLYVQFHSVPGALSDWTTYNEKELNCRLNEDLLQQFRLRVEAQKISGEKA